MQLGVGGGLDRLRAVLMRSRRLSGCMSTGQLVAEGNVLPVIIGGSELEIEDVDDVAEEVVEEVSELHRD